MRSYNHGRFQEQASFLRRQFLQDGELPFASVLSEDIVAQAVEATGVVWLDRIYSPLVTPWVFLGQVLSADHSCRAAVARLITHRLSRGERSCSATTGAYCQARKRLPEQFFSAVACLVGRALDAKVDSRWLWKGRRVCMFDGTTVSMPDTPENQVAYVTIREARFRVEQPGFRTKAIVVVTTLLDPVETTKDDLAALYRARWNNELDLRSIKSTMQMDILRCKTPDLVHKEVWTHILAYNLIRTIMAQAATNHGVEPRTISFKGTLQTLEAFRPLLDFQGRRDAAFRAVLYEQLLDAVALHRVANRPDRFEPRYRKRRSKRYAELKLPRQEAKLAILKGLSNYLKTRFRVSRQ